MALSFPRLGGGSEFFMDPFFGGFPDVTREFARALQPFEGGAGQQLATRGMPIDLVEKDTAFELKADIPGVDKSDIKVTVDKDVLRINVEKKEEKREEGGEGERRWHRYERSSSFVGRALRMPESANLEGIKATYRDGVLTLDVPKLEQKEEETKRITIA